MMGLKKGITWANFQKDGNMFSDNDQLNNNVGGLTIMMVDLVDFNILGLIQSGPMALFIGNIVIMCDISCSLMIMLLQLLLHKLYILCRVTLVSSIVEIDDKYEFKASILSVSEYAYVFNTLNIINFYLGDFIW